MATNPTTLRQSSPPSAFADMLSLRLPFRVSESFWALPGGSASLGQLPDTDAVRYASQNVAYTVYSYLTPVAWQTDTGEWVMPGVYYGVTTAKVQNKVRDAIRLLTENSRMV